MEIRRGLIRGRFGDVEEDRKRFLLLRSDAQALSKWRQKIKQQPAKPWFYPC